MTKIEFEKTLNERYSEDFNSSEAVESFGHLGTVANVQKHWFYGTLGTLLRRREPETFEALYMDAIKESA
jgi:hypothetical protein